MVASAAFEVKVSWTMLASRQKAPGGALSSVCSCIGREKCGRQSSQLVAAWLWRQSQHMLQLQTIGRTSWSCLSLSWAGTNWRASWGMINGLWPRMDSGTLTPFLLFWTGERNAGAQSAKQAISSSAENLRICTKQGIAPTSPELGAKWTDHDLVAWEELAFMHCCNASQDKAFIKPKDSDGSESYKFHVSICPRAK